VEGVSGFRVEASAHQIVCARWFGDASNGYAKLVNQVSQIDGSLHHCISIGDFNPAIIN
jgi:hypothetical protein